VTDECRPAAGAADGSLHWLKPANHAAQIWWWEAGEWRDRIGYARSPQVQAMWGFTYHLPASPDDATERARLERENARLREALDIACEGLLIVSGQRQCIDNLLSHEAVALEALRLIEGPNNDR